MSDLDSFCVFLRIFPVAIETINLLENGGASRGNFRNLRTSRSLGNFPRHLGTTILRTEEVLFSSAAGLTSKRMVDG